MDLNNFFNQCFKTIIGNEKNIKLTLSAIISEGSILIEDYPGTGKTTFAKTITHNLSLDFKRIQFTSDLLPADILGYNYIKDNKQIFQKGPIFSNVVLADELNRGSAKSQSAFLEAMEEKTVTIDGETYSLPTPFFVIATQNPMDSSGTSMLPDSQLDRFMISFSLSKLSDQQKKEVLKLNNQLKEQASIKLNFKEIQLKKDQITVNDTIYQYLVDIEKMINQSGKDFQISPRCLKQTIELAKGWALINQQAFVSHQDVKDVIPSVLRHRIRFLSNDNEKQDFIEKQILQKVPVNK